MDSTEKVAMLVLRAFGIRKKQTSDMQVSVTSTDLSIRSMMGIGKEIKIKNWIFEK